MADGFEPVRTIDGPVLCAVVTDDVLRRAGSPYDTRTIAYAREQGMQCISMNDTTRIWQATPGPCPHRPERPAARVSPHHQGAYRNRHMQP
ncbi:hypothetical protein [Rhodococcus opacus]|uniref:hypothetical protein n=1 Tax=Rhodococcus opacus TaxID=37919 RepID=UPI001300256F|nr:hypothetical protein [Rhodococcus opacus]